jgi:hypothetical protein
MNRLLSFAALAILALIFLAGASQTVVSPGGSYLDPMEVTIEIAPAQAGPYELLRGPNMFTCTARLTVPETNKLIGTATVNVSPGSEGTKTVTAGELTIILNGKIAKASTGAVAEVTVRRNGQLITRQKSTLLLARAGSRYY